MLLLRIQRSGTSLGLYRIHHSGWHLVCGLLYCWIPQWLCHLSWCGFQRSNVSDHQNHRYTHARGIAWNESTLHGLRRFNGHFLHTTHSTWLSTGTNTRISLDPIGTTIEIQTQRTSNLPSSAGFGILRWIKATFPSPSEQTSATSVIQLSWQWTGEKFSFACSHRSWLRTWSDLRVTLATIYSSGDTSHLFRSSFVLLHSSFCLFSSLAIWWSLSLTHMLYLYWHTACTCTMKLHRRKNETDDKCLIEEKTKRPPSKVWATLKDNDDLCWIFFEIRRTVWKLAKGTWKAFKVGFIEMAASPSFSCALEPTAVATTIVEHRTRNKETYRWPNDRSSSLSLFVSKLFSIMFYIW